MPTRAQAPPAVPRLTYLRIKNYRALRDVEFRDLTPLTVLIGPNGSGKSTVLDALAFLAEAVSGNLVQAWEDRNRFAGMLTRESQGKIEFEIRVLLENNNTLRYEINIDESDSKVFVADESLTLLGSEDVKIFELYDVNQVSREFKNIFRNNIYRHYKTEERSNSPSYRPLLASIFTLPDTSNDSAFHWAVDLAKLLTSYRYFNFTGGKPKGYSDQGPRERLSISGDNLPNVLYYLQTKHSKVFSKIIVQLRRRIPVFAEVITEITSDERLLLRFRDAPFEKPFSAQYMSGGMWKLVALFALLYEPDAAGLLGIEEPENELHPRLLVRLPEELGKVSETRQLLVATHSPFLLDGLAPEQVWILDRGADGYTQATRTADIPNVPQLVEDGSPLGYLWSSNFFSVGDPLAPRNAADAR